MNPLPHAGMPEAAIPVDSRFKRRGAREKVFASRWARTPGDRVRDSSQGRKGCSGDHVVVLPDEAESQRPAGCTEWRKHALWVPTVSERLWEVPGVRSSGVHSLTEPLPCAGWCPPNFFAPHRLHGHCFKLPTALQITRGYHFCLTQA